MDSAAIQMLVNETVNLFNAKFLTILIRVMLGLLAIVLLKIVVEGVAAWLLFRTDAYVSVGSPVEVFGKKGWIKAATWKTVVVETGEGFLRIPMKEWHSSKYTVLKDQVLLRNRRKGDKDEK